MRGGADIERIEDRRIDLFFIIGAVFVVAAGGMIHYILLNGDWDFWVDWKDRQWWVVVTPLGGMIVPAIVQNIAWSALRLPVGATLTALTVVLAAWVDRLVNFHGWAGYPLTLVFPATLVPQAVLLDVVLFLTRSFTVTSLIGALAWGVLFGPVNWPMVLAYMQPVDFHGFTLTLADVMGFQYVRTAVPEYIRLIEQGNLRAFLEESSYVSAAFAGFASIAVYWLGFLIAKVFALDPVKKFLRHT